MNDCLDTIYKATTTFYNIVASGGVFFAAWKSKDFLAEKRYERLEGLYDEVVELHRQQSTIALAAIDSSKLTDLKNIRSFVRDKVEHQEHWLRVYGVLDLAKAAVTDKASERDTEALKKKL